MRVSGLLNLLVDVSHVGKRVPLNGRVNRAFSDSREIGADDLFIALPGYKSQGVDYLEQAFDSGCVTALIPEEAEVSDEWRARCISLGRIRYNAAQAACAAFGNPTEHLVTFGVTGTNGKTSTCHILRHLLHAAGHRVVLITTVAHEFGDWRRETPNTTPDAARLQSVLAQAREEGASAAVLEVSAHGVTLDRITGCRFDGLIFTNLSADHLDFYDDMESYFQAKLELFHNEAFHKARCVGAACTDDEWGRRIADESRIPVWSYGVEPYEGNQHVDAGTLEVTAAGIQGPLAVGDQSYSVSTSLTATFNRLNLAGATALATAAGIAPKFIQKGLEQPIEVPGRLMRVPSSAPFRVVVDFAHTEQAMENLLTGLRAECQGKLIVVYGAGGDRDPERRRGLTRMVVRHADVGVITLDNPRSEPPDSIIEAMEGHWQDEVEDGADTLQTPARKIVQHDRKLAIALALDLAHDGDIVVLAGKGHETGQIFADHTEPHDDREVAAACLEERGFAVSGEAPEQNR